MKIREECKGCVYNSAPCHIRGIKKVNKCPCVLCLVKVMCERKMLCSERNRVVATYFKGEIIEWED
jgi:hypothetical protein